MRNLILLYMAVMNLTGLLLMGLDKRYSRIQGKRRIPEKTLLLIALFGGAVGSYIGMKQFRHKTLHNRFRYGIPAMMVLHLALIILYLLKTGNFF